MFLELAVQTGQFTNSMRHFEQEQEQVIKKLHSVYKLTVYTNDTPAKFSTLLGIQRPT